MCFHHYSTTHSALWIQIFIKVACNLKELIYALDESAYLNLT